MWRFFFPLKKTAGAVSLRNTSPVFFGRSQKHSVTSIQSDLEGTTALTKNFLGGQVETPVFYQDILYPSYRAAHRGFAHAIRLAYVGIGTILAPISRNGAAIDGGI